MSNYLNQQQQPAAPKEAQRDLAATAPPPLLTRVPAPSPEAAGA